MSLCPLGEINVFLEDDFELPLRSVFKATKELCNKVGFSLYCALIEFTL